MKIGVVVGSIRDGRKGGKVGSWVMSQARSRSDAEYVLIDLKTFDLPLLTSLVHPAQAGKKYESDNVQRWSEAIDACDGFVFVTPEYNHGIPGAFKNAFDSISPEWADKPVAFVSYGSVAGARAVSQWRQIVGVFNMYDLRDIVSFSTFDDFDADGNPIASDRKIDSLNKLLASLEKAAER